MFSRVPYRIQRAGEPDLSEVMATFEQRSEWLRDVKDSSQWSNVAEWRTLIRHLVRHGNVWVLVENNGAERVVGTVTLSKEPDFDFWRSERRYESAFYLSKLATAPAYAGRELGRLMLDWAVDRAARRSVPRVRLDTWKTSDELRAYYAEREWTNMGVVDLGHRQSGALFERRAEHLGDRLATFIVEREERGIRGGGTGVLDVVSPTTMPMPVPAHHHEPELFV